MPIPQIERTMGHELEPSARAAPGGGVIRRAGGEELRIGPQEAMPQAQQFKMPPQLQNRNEYEKFLQSRYGDPWADERELSNRSRDMESLINDTAKQEERGFFDHVFGGQYRYEDIGKLDKKALDHWQNQQLILRKNVETQHKQDFEVQMQDIEVRKDQMGDQMKVFDNYVKMFKPDDKSGKPDRTLVKTLQDGKVIWTPRGEAAGMETVSGRPDILGELLGGGMGNQGNQTDWKSDPNEIKRRFKAGEFGEGQAGRDKARKLLKKAGM